MNRDQVIAKIKKCLALGKSTNPNEAATAMRQAQKLMAEHNVSEREMSLIDVNEVQVKAVSTAANVWEVHLANTVAQAFGCDNFANISGQYNSAGNYQKLRHYVFVGLAAAPSVAGYAYEVLSRQCAKARLAHIAKQPKNCKPLTKTTRGDAFAKGWVVAVADLIKRFANPEKNEALLLAYLEVKHPELKQSKSRDTTKARKVAFGHRMAGYKAGQSAQLNRAVSGAAQQELLT
ncbi:MAG: DUF2786 domain-containing protein [Burkholderiaceae bacterium]